MTGKRELELYFHIPFCVRKCLYCDFLSAPADGRTKARYMDSLNRETEERAGDYRNYRVVSVFVGGGTPSTVSPEQLCRLLEIVRADYDLAVDAEITVEVNPGTVDERMLRCYRQAGVNRLSIGLQSADDRELAVLGRIHTYGQFLETYYTARKCGFSNINVDLMSALPGQTLSDYLGTLEKVLGLEPAPEHISAYSLIVEEGTPFYEMDRKGALVLPDEECDRLMYEKTGELLEKAGYRRYEISNYARPGCECRHNCGYWRRREYLGLGIGAASLIGNCRFRNGDSLAAYLDDPLGVREEEEELSLEEQMEEFMFLGLRMTEGVPVSEFEALFGKRPEQVYGAVIEKNIRDGLLEYRSREASGEPVREEAESCGEGGAHRDPEEGGKAEIYGQTAFHAAGETERRCLALTKKGLDVSNMVMAQFLL